MSSINNQNRKGDLAIAMAGGTPVKDWAQTHGIAERTAYRWARSPEVVDQVEAIRRESLDRAVNRLSGMATDAAEEIARLAREASSESVRLQAARAVLSELMAISGFAALERRMAEIERRLHEGSSAVVTAGDPRHEMTGPDDPSDFPSVSPVEEIGG
ncbi:MAG: hypothetical protein ACYC61_33050 [Isosphaeraceae bacterium]